jgi:aryl-alcohol dehydrogenase-like predicted oxidoreductase
MHGNDRSGDVVGAMAELVAAGKVRYLGLSEVTARNPWQPGHRQDPSRLASH